MAGNPHPNMSGLKKFSSTYQPKKAGRKKSILTKYAKDNGISKEDIRGSFQYLLGLNLEQLQDVLKDKKQPAIIVLVATSLIKDMSKGKTAQLEMVMRKANIDPEADLKTEEAHDLDGSRSPEDNEQFHQYEYPEAEELE